MYLFVYGYQLLSPLYKKLHSVQAQRRNKGLGKTNRFCWETEIVMEGWDWNSRIKWVGEE